MKISPQIVRKQLSSTGEEISSIGFGTWNYRGGVSPLATAIQQGATFIDTAESYGTEEVVGQALHGCRTEVFLASKVHPLNFRKQDVIRACEGSLKRLETDYVDLYQLHWPNYSIPIEETMSAMEDLANAGKIRYIGVSNFTAQELAVAQRCLGKHRIVSNQLRYSLIERTIESGDLQYCQHEQIMVIAFSPLGVNFSSLRKNDPDGVFPSLAAKYHRSTAQLALNWLLQKPGVVVIPKASSTEHVIDNCGASGWQMELTDYQLLTDKIHCRRRGPAERFARRLIKRIVNSFGRTI